MALAGDAQARSVRSESPQHSFQHVVRGARRCRSNVLLNTTHPPAAKPGSPFSARDNGCTRVHTAARPCRCRSMGLIDLALSVIARTGSPGSLTGRGSDQCTATECVNEGHVIEKGQCTSFSLRSRSTDPRVSVQARRTQRDPHHLIVRHTTQIRTSDGFVIASGRRSRLAFCVI